MNMQTACITFDQPLWLKTVEIAHVQSMNAVCRLSAFHMLMSFQGSMGCFMAGSGIHAANENFCGPISIGYMLTGKSIARAVRRHLWIDAVLNVLIPADIDGDTQ
jgi:hypothetical protein